MQGRYETRMLYNVLTCLLTAIGSSSATKGKPHTHKFWRRRRSTWAAVTTILCRQPHDKAMLWNFFDHGSPFAYRGYDSAIYHLNAFEYESTIALRRTCYQAHGKNARVKCINPCGKAARHSINLADRGVQ
jgi:hypothetical protein